MFDSIIGDDKPQLPSTNEINNDLFWKEANYLALMVFQGWFKEDTHTHDGYPGRCDIPETTVGNCV